MSPNTKGAPAPKSTAERQRAYRARKANSDLAEVRGLFAPPSLHEQIKQYAAKISKKNE